MKDLKKKTSPKNQLVPGGEWQLSCKPKDVRGFSRLEVNNKTHPNVTFDSVVVDDWLHAEQLNETEWHVILGGRSFRVEVSKNKKVPSRVFRHDGGAL